MDYLYRVLYKGDIIYDATEEKDAVFFAGLLKDQDNVKIERAELIWWNLPPKEFDRDST